MQKNYRADLPIGFTMALAENTEAMQVFSNLSENSKKSCIEKARAVHSREEMQKLVEDISRTVI